MITELNTNKTGKIWSLLTVLQKIKIRKRKVCYFICVARSSHMASAERDKLKPLGALEWCPGNDELSSSPSEKTWSEWWHSSADLVRRNSISNLLGWLTFFGFTRLKTRPLVTRGICSTEAIWFTDSASVGTGWWDCEGWGAIILKVISVGTSMFWMASTADDLLTVYLISRYCYIKILIKQKTTYSNNTISIVTGENERIEYVFPHDVITTTHSDDWNYV